MRVESDWTGGGHLQLAQGAGGGGDDEVIGFAQAAVRAAMASALVARIRGGW